MTVGVLIFFAIVGAFICVRARVAAGAVVFSVIAVVLFVTTPLGAGLPGAISQFFSTVGHVSGPVLDGSASRGVG